MKTDQKVAQPAPSPQAGEIGFPVEQAGGEEKAARRVEGKKMGTLQLLQWARLHSPPGSALSARTPGHTATCLRLQQAPRSGHLGMRWRRDHSTSFPPT